MPRARGRVKCGSTYPQCRVRCYRSLKQEISHKRVEMADCTERFTQARALIARERLDRNLVAGRKTAVHVGKLLSKNKVDEDLLCARQRIKIGIAPVAKRSDSRESCLC